MAEKLSGDELAALVKSVFSPSPDETRVAILADLPDDILADNPAWQDRRAIAFEMYEALNAAKDKAGLKQVTLAIYRNVHNNNADLRDTVYITGQSPEHKFTADLETLGTPTPLRDLLAGHHMIFAPTQLSATAPLKLLSKELGCRGVTMPGFSRGMIPALRLDYEEINRRVNAVKAELDPAVSMDIAFTVDGKEKHDIHFDLRHRTAHASGGRFPKKGTAGNLPSGECYIVPYEGELADTSLSQGTLPVQFEDEVVLYRIEMNKAVRILSTGPYSEKEAQRIQDEPAYANISELGFGVLKDFGCTPTGVILLDEKLGLHIAFGRSDHFGGAVGVKDFSSPEAVVHIDRIYIPETQPRVNADRVVIKFEDGSNKILMENGAYTLF